MLVRQLQQDGQCSGLTGWGVGCTYQQRKGNLGGKSYYEGRLGWALNRSGGKVLDDDDSTLLLHQPISYHVLCLLETHPIACLQGRSQRTMSCLMKTVW
jgi:hypothetical protein